MEPGPGRRRPPRPDRGRSRPPHVEPGARAGLVRNPGGPDPPGAGDLVAGREVRGGVSQLADADGVDCPGRAQWGNLDRDVPPFEGGQTDRRESPTIADGPTRDRSGNRPLNAESPNPHWLRSVAAARGGVMPGYSSHPAIGFALPGTRAIRGAAAESTQIPIGFAFSRRLQGMASAGSTQVAIGFAFPAQPTMRASWVPPQLAIGFVRPLAGRVRRFSRRRCPRARIEGHLPVVNAGCRAAVVGASRRMFESIDRIPGGVEVGRLRAQGDPG